MAYGELLPIFAILFGWNGPDVDYGRSSGYGRQQTIEEKGSDLLAGRIRPQWQFGDVRF